MQLDRRGDELWAKFDDPDVNAASAPAPRIERQIVMTTGSHHQQAYWYRTDKSRLLGQLPAIYLIAEQQWIPRAAAFLRPPSDRVGSETGRWNSVCINCHTTHGKRNVDGPPGSAATNRHADSTVAEFGIACEACHGPSQDHAAINTNPIRRYALHTTGAADATVIQPARLDPRRSSQVCGQCHGVWEFYAPADEHRANKEGFPYRPGHELRDTRFVVQPTINLTAPTMQRLLAAYPAYVADSFWPDGMIRVSGREYNGLVDSPCYTKATDLGRTLSCSSCHAMHKQSADRRTTSEWADGHQLADHMDGNDACTQCHTTMQAAVASHTHHQANSSGSLCYNCHMPYTTYGLLRAMRSHQISSPSAGSSHETGRPNACNGCHVDRTLQWTSERLTEWYRSPPAVLDVEERRVAASLLWLLRGDAGQRALAAWSYGWPPAQRASGSAWQPPYLSLLLNDPYDAVRLIALRSLKALPGFADFSSDAIGTATLRLSDSRRAAALWDRIRDRDHTPALERLLFKGGELDLDAITRLINRRDDRRVNLRE
jgi:hypothetical protein